MRREGTGGERKAPKRSQFARSVNRWHIVTYNERRRNRAGKTKPISGRLNGAWVRRRLVSGAGGEWRAGGASRGDLPAAERRGQETLAERVNAERGSWR